jgi:hypothetical protein
MSTIKFISKLTDYQLKDDRNLVIQSPFIEPSLTNINFQNKTFLIEFVQKRDLPNKFIGYSGKIGIKIILK